MTDRNAPLGLGSFWEQADAESNDEHPLERELCHRLDAVARYLRMIQEATLLADDEAVEQLVRQHDREENMVRQIRAALRRAKPRFDGRLPRETPARPPVIP